MMNSPLTFIVGFLTLCLLGTAMFFSYQEAVEYTGPEKVWEKTSWNLDNFKNNISQK